MISFPHHICRWQLTPAGGKLLLHRNGFFTHHSCCWQLTPAGGKLSYHGLLSQFCKKNRKNSDSWKNYENPEIWKTWCYWTVTIHSKECLIRLLFRAGWSWSTLFAQTILSESLGSLWYTKFVIEMVSSPPYSWLSGLTPAGEKL